MTVREVRLAGRRFTVTGEGYGTRGEILATDGSTLPTSLTQALTAMALCTDAVVGDTVTGDPTEAALVVLAEMGGIDVAALRGQRPRLHEIPFDPDHKFMATFHHWPDDQGRPEVRAFVKGSPDVLVARADPYLGGNELLPLDDGERRRYAAATADLARRGMRVLAVGFEDLPGSGLDTTGDTRGLVDRLILIALVGIVDPPRPEAKDATAECQTAGIRVRMVTGRIRSSARQRV